MVRRHNEIRLDADADAPHTITPSGYFVNWIVAVSFHWHGLTRTHMLSGPRQDRLSSLKTLFSFLPVRSASSIFASMSRQNSIRR